MAIENHDDYIAAQPEWARPLLSRLRGQIATLVPEADECISYNMPAFRLPDGKVVAGYAGFKKHCAYLPHSGGVLAACADALQGYAMTQGSLHFTADKPLSDALVRTLIDARMAEIAAVAAAKAARKGKKA